MMPYQLVMALALLTSPPECLESLDSAALHPWLAPALCRLAIAMEIMDPKEAVHLLVDTRHFAADLRLLGGRFRDLADAPHLADCRLLPSSEMIGDFLAVNRAFQESIEKRLAFDPLHAHELRRVLEENEQLHQVWDAANVARRPIFYVTVRRHALKQLRERIGAHNFDCGDLPPNVPMWRIDHGS